MNLYQKLLAITDEVGKIEKTGSNSQQGYKFIEQAQVVASLRPLMVKHGVVIIPETVARTTERFLNAKANTVVHANVVSRYTIINAEKPEERIICDWDAGEALDTSDKATNKATTASDKYFLMKLFNISDKEDPDRESHEPVGKSFTKLDMVKRYHELAGKIGLDADQLAMFNQLHLEKDRPETGADLKTVVSELEKLEANHGATV